jgi:pyruvate dehydrogenase E1 component
VYCFIGDGETDEPETLGAITLASREKLDNLTFIINCNLQRLDGPVRGNGKIIQELETAFRGAGWNVIKVIWGSNWDPLFERDTEGLLLRRFDEIVDGEFQKFVVEGGRYIREKFFGSDPRLLDLVKDLSDDDLAHLQRGGHDPVKVYAAYKAALEHKGRPTVILAKTVKGYGLGEAGEARNTTHQQKKMTEDALRYFRTRFQLPISDDKLLDKGFYRPAQDSPEVKYVLDRRKALGGPVPARVTKHQPIEIPSLDFFKSILAGSGKQEPSTTGAFVAILNMLLRAPGLGRHIVPIIPDEARTFGMDSMFKPYGIYSSAGQLYDPVDSKFQASYREATNGQILEEGITEAGSMASFISAGSAYSTHGLPMIPFYIYYSMFGFQRIGDQAWLAGDMRVRGFMLGATAGRTTLNGEGLQHQDGQSHLQASIIPNVIAYDPAYAYEIAVIIQDGIRRMYAENEDVIYYLTLQNETYAMPPMPEGVAPGIIKGMYKLRPAPVKDGKRSKVHLLGSAVILRECLRAQELLANRYGVAADVWSVTSYKELRRDALACERWNRLHPTAAPRKSYLEATLENEPGVYVAASDYIKATSEMIARWVPGGLLPLGTDGFGRSDDRDVLRRHFEVDAENIAVASLTQLMRKKEVAPDMVAKAIKELGIDPDKIDPVVA